MALVIAPEPSASVQGAVLNGLTEETGRIIEKSARRRLGSVRSCNSIIIPVLE